MYKIFRTPAHHLGRSTEPDYLLYEGKLYPTATHPRGWSEKADYELRADGKIYRYIGAETIEVLLADEDFSDAARWEDTSLVTVTNGTLVKDLAFNTVYRYSGADIQVNLAEVDYANAAGWQDMSLVQVTSGTLVKDIEVDKVYRYTGAGEAVDLTTVQYLSLIHI